MDDVPRRAKDRAIHAFERAYDRAPTFVVQAPGRVNLIGEHTDYNDGFVLPMALPFVVAIAAEPRADQRVVAASEGYDPVEFWLKDPVDPSSGWATYVHGTATILAQRGHPVSAWQGVLASDIPSGANLSSSAALEVASGLAFTIAAGATIDMIELARVGQLVENDILGLPSGIMDQLASATSFAGMASLIDCRDLSITRAVLPPGVDVVIMDTGTRRELVDSAYAARRADCETAAAELGVASLRDASLEHIGRISDERIRRRARHVITENARTLQAAEAMRDQDASRLGQLMNESHSSLRTDFDVSGPALNAIVALAQGTPGCLGARMTGGGFAGCAIALVETGETAAFTEHIGAVFSSPAEQPAAAPAQLYTVAPSNGAAVVTDQ